MNARIRTVVLTALLTLPAAMAHAATDSEALKLFHNARQSEQYFHSSYGYAILPTVGKGGIVVGAAHGSGHVYRHGHRIGRVSMTQVSVGMQLGGEAYSEIIFFKDKSALDDFTSGHFEFSADAGAIAVTASADASVGTTGANAGASLTKEQAAMAGEYDHGMAVFTIAKGGLMYNATIGGQKFTFHPDHG